MINSIAIASSQSHLGQRVTISGFAHSIRHLGKLAFMTIRDASGLIQAVVQSPELLELVGSLQCETPVRAIGFLVSNSKNAQSVELSLQSLEILSPVADAPPIEISKDSKVENLALSKLLDYRCLSLRNPKVRAIFKIESEITRAFGEFLRKEGFVEIHSPKIVATGTEGGAQLFKLDYFERPAFLAQSPQFYKQIMVGVFERVFEIGPVYRAEEHDTTRHLNEYVSMDFEMGFIESEQNVIEMQKRLLAHIFRAISESCSMELAMYGVEVPVFEDIPQITLAEAVILLEEKYGWQGKESGDLDPEGERLLCRHFGELTGNELVYVVRYPLASRPFYTMPAGSNGCMGSIEENGLKSRSFDLLFNGLEITTGGQRIHEHAMLKRTMVARGLNPEDFQEYLQCFRYGMPPHGGLAIGLERLAKQLLGLPSVKQASLFPRDMNRLRP